MGILRVLLTRIHAIPCAISIQPKSSLPVSTSTRTWLPALAPTPPCVFSAHDTCTLSAPSSAPRSFSDNGLGLALPASCHNLACSFPSSRTCPLSTTPAAPSLAILFPSASTPTSNIVIASILRRQSTTHRPPTPQPTASRALLDPSACARPGATVSVLWCCWPSASHNRPVLGVDTTS